MLAKHYPSDLTEEQWEYIKQFIPRAKPGGRRRTTNLRLTINAIFYLNRSGCAWRYLPSEFPPWQTVYKYFRQWQREGIWQLALNKTTKCVRTKAGRCKYPHLVLIDAQSVRAHYGEERGYDGFKKVRGRKREIVVDTLGQILSCCVHRANQSEARGAIKAIQHYQTEQLHQPTAVLGDSAYGKAPFDLEVFRMWELWPETVKGQKTHGFVSNLKPQRWIVERSFAWMNNFRRLARDFERSTEVSEGQVYICGLQLSLSKLFGDFP